MASVTLRSKKQSNGYNLYLDIYEKGERIREFLGITLTEDYTSANGKKRIKPEDKQLYEVAIQYTKRREYEIISEGLGVTKHYKGFECFIRFIEKYQETNFEPNRQNALGHLKVFAENKPLPYNKVDEVFLSNFRDYLLQRCAKVTTKNYLGRLQVMWNEARLQKKTKLNPFENVQKPKPEEPKREYLTEQEVQALFNCKTGAPDVIRHAFLFACCTGLRISDLLRLKWADVQQLPSDPTRSQLVVRQKKSGTRILHIPINPTAQSILDAQKKVAVKELVFENLPTYNSEYNNALREWSKQAGITKKMHSHLARHTFATLSLISGADIFTVSKLLGHSSISMTEVYARVVESKRVAAVDMLPNFANQIRNELPNTN